MGVELSSQLPATVERSWNFEEVVRARFRRAAGIGEPGKLPTGLAHTMLLTPDKPAKHRLGRPECGSHTALGRHVSLNTRKLQMHAIPTCCGTLRAYTI
jgi:hypothetical protein